jgi:HAD superfamily hydrolase (TIGR01549 family)
MSTRRFRAVLFDWDGTLVDSAEATYRSYVSLFAHYGITYERRLFALTYSPAWQRTYRAVGLPEEHWPEADERWLALYAGETSALLPGARPALEALDAAGLLLGLVTSGDRSRVTGELRELGVSHLFQAVVCGGDLPAKKPRPEPLLMALDLLAVRPEEIAYVGDSPEDIQMTKTAGGFAVAIPGGFPNHEALAASGPDAHARDLGEAVALLLGDGPVRSS